ncbi:MAG: glycerate kinase [Verrucomicrobia bacterium]|nr:glycerate kinase [Verrucomicrobiota bacterium]
MRVLLAFDKFKDCLTAPAACALAAAALRERHPAWELDACPLADGGEGFADILTRAAGGTLQTETVTGPRGQPVTAAFGLVPWASIPAGARTLLDLPAGAAGRPVAVLEMASASGLALLAAAARDPWATSTAGTGELIRAAAAAGAGAVLLGVGGSATHDLGLGALTALGLRTVNAQGAPLANPIPRHWADATGFAGRVNPALPPLRIACDVTNPLAGPRGAAATYGPQKGLQMEDLARLDAESVRLARALCGHCGQPERLAEVPGAGAAGGIAFGLMAAAGARLLPGFDLVAAWLDLEARLAAADLVLTGEGRFDVSSLQGKGPGAVAARALARGKRVVVLAGQATLPEPPPGLVARSISPPGLPLAEALREAPERLAAAARELD